MDRETALSIYKNIMTTCQDVCLNCVDVSETVDTQGLSPLYELQIKPKDFEKTRNIISNIQIESIVVTETNDGFFII